MDKLILVNKEKGVTSRDVVNELIKIFNTKKIGHFGTLDPLATGLLVVGIGKYTKIGNLFSNDVKGYEVEVLIGKSTDSYDITGNVLKSMDAVISIDELKSVILSFIDKYYQEVPIYSAVKVNGKKLYEYARENKKVDLPKKEVEIFEINNINLYKKNGDSYFSFTCLVSKGTYIRSLINDISKKIGICMCMSNLKRISQDKFSINNSYTLSQIKNGDYKFLDIEDVIDLDIMKVPDNLEKLIINGSLIEMFNRKPILFMKDKEKVALYVTYSKDNSKMKPFFIF